MSAHRHPAVIKYPPSLVAQRLQTHIQHSPSHCHSLWIYSATVSSAALSGFAEGRPGWNRHVLEIQNKNCMLRSGTVYFLCNMPLNLLLALLRVAVDKRNPGSSPSPVRGGRAAARAASHVCREQRQLLTHHSPASEVSSGCAALLLLYWSCFSSVTWKKHLT